MPNAVLSPRSVTVSEARLRELGPVPAPMPVLGGTPPDGVPLSALLTEEHLASLLCNDGRTQDRAERTAHVSLWSRWCFSQLIGATLACELLLGCQPPLDRDDTLWLLDADGMPEALFCRTLITGAETGLAAHSPFLRFQPLWVYLHELIANLTRCTAAPAGLFWSNAGALFDLYLLALEQHPQVLSAALHDARAVLSAESGPEGQRNPLYQARRDQQLPDGRYRRLRRHCCRCHRLPEHSICGDCPLQRQTASKQRSTDVQA